MAKKSKYVLITGGTNGIGYELAKLFVQDDYNIINVARGQRELTSVAEEFRAKGVEVINICKDLFKKNAPFEVYEEVKSKGIEIDVLVNNAGQGEFGEFVDNDLEKELQIIQLNVNATVILTKLFIKDMVKRGEGKILNLASIAGKSPGPYQAVYHGTKAFIHSFTEGLRQEVKDNGVSLTSLLPGATNTDFFNKAHMQSSKIVQEGDLGDPKKVAKDGYKALMDEKHMIVSGIKNKLATTMSDILPDNMAAKQMGKMQEPLDKNNGKS